MSTELTTTTDTISPSMTAGDLKRKLKNESKKREVMAEYIRNGLRPKVDYDITHAKAKKPSLLKPGSEKICSLLNLDISFETDTEIREGLPEKVKENTVCLKCILTDRKTGMKVAEGRGAASLDEKKTSSGENVYTVNTIVKLAEKRAQVDATLRLAALSDSFSQDGPDIVVEGDQSEEVIEKLNNAKSMSAVTEVINDLNATKYRIQPQAWGKIKEASVRAKARFEPKQEKKEEKPKENNKDEIAKKLQEEIDALKRTIEREEADYNNSMEHPTDTDQFYKACERQRQKIVEMSDLLQEKIDELSKLRDEPTEEEKVILKIQEYTNPDELQAWWSKTESPSPKASEFYQKHLATISQGQTAMKV